MSASHQAAGGHFVVRGVDVTMRFVSLLVAALVVLLAAPDSLIASAGSPSTRSKQWLPMGTVFKGTGKFNQLVRMAEAGNWRSLSIGDRTARVGKALLGTPYVNYTLEIDDRVESPSVNFNGMDCWTFYEISLGFARMLRCKQPPYEPADLLSMIELERYRNGQCDGGYLSRMHFLEEVFYDNGRRGLSDNPTRSLGGVRLQRSITEMTSAWRSYRYLRSNPGLLKGMAKIQDKVSALPVYHIPRANVAGIESKLKTGDIVAITSRDPSGYTSHVGMIVKEGNKARFMHATSNRSRGRAVILDDRISDYLKRSSDHYGIVVYRPKDI